MGIPLAKIKALKHSLVLEEYNKDM